MAMEIFVLSNQRLTSITEWQRAIDAEGFSLKLSPDSNITDLRGFLPTQYQSRSTGFECDHWSPHSIVEIHSRIDVGGPWMHALAFRFGGRPGELESAWIAAAAYARATRGILFDTEEGKVFQPDDAMQLIRRIERNRPLMDAVRADIDRKFGLK